MQGLNVSKRVLRYAGRDIIRVTMPHGTRVGFYRSTGQSSGMPGQWLPFDGLDIRHRWTGGAWIHKTRYCHGKPPELHRFGSTVLKRASAALGRRKIRPGEKASPSTVNAFLRTAEAAAISKANAEFLQQRRAAKRAADRFLGIRVNRPI